MKKNNTYKIIEKFSENKTTLKALLEEYVIRQYKMNIDKERYNVSK